ncbi:hypothetical protein Mapa_007457 [Marchantia paleacea]|nr:hypothetical protein Mapa_007457 [Marchantia paleacea]
MRPRLVFVDDLPSSQPYMHILQGHQDYWHSTEKTVGASPVTTSNLLLQKAVPLLLKLRTCRILHAIYDGLPACRAGSCREKYKEKKPYWCDSIRLCVSGPNACNDTDEFPGVPPRSPPPPADPYFDPKYCSGAHIRGFDRKTNSCLCEEGW